MESEMGMAMAMAMAMPVSRVDPYFAGARHEEWAGASSQKFGTQRLHLQAKESGFINEANLTRKHFPQQLSADHEWKPCRKVVQHRADGLFDER